MKTEHKIFLAIPFDSATRALYTNITARIRELKLGSSLTNCTLSNQVDTRLKMFDKQSSRN
jgi:hypothetical protein